MSNLTSKQYQSLQLEACHAGGATAASQLLDSLIAVYEAGRLLHDQDTSSSASSAAWPSGVSPTRWTRLCRVRRPSRAPGRGWSRPSRTTRGAAPLSVVSTTMMHPGRRRLVGGGGRGLADQATVCGAAVRERNKRFSLKRKMPKGWLRE